MNDLFLATVSSYDSTGVSLLIDGEDTPTIKKYKWLKSYTPANGQRVLVARVNGSYVILGRI